MPVAEGQQNLHVTAKPEDAVFACRLGIVPTKPTVESPDGGIAKRTLVICPLSVVSFFSGLRQAGKMPLAV